MKELVLELENLCCPNCAQKIQKEVGELGGVKRAALDFMTRRLKIEAEEEVISGLPERVTRIVAAIEPDTVVKVPGEKDQSGFASPKEWDRQKPLIRIAVGAALFIAALLYPGENWVQIALFFAAYVVIGGQVVLQAAKNIFRGQVFDENLLMSLATVGAFCIGEYPEGVAVMLFYQVGEFFQSFAVNRSRKSITDLMDIKPEFAHVRRDGQIVTLSPWEAHIGDILIVKPGEKIPLDGTVREGRSTVDASALTGESLPREIKEKDEVLSGAINKTGVIAVEVTQEFSQSTVMKILELTEKAGEKKAKAENFITKFARVYTPAVVAAAAALAFLPPLVVPGAAFSDWIYRGLVFLVISCPCALVISVPLSFFAGIGVASRQGILVKGGNYLEALAKAKISVFDKTGTLTKGNFEVDEIVPLSMEKEELLSYAALAQSISNHPVSQAVKRAWGKENDMARILSGEEVAGLGVAVVTDRGRLLSGNAGLMEKEGISYTPAPSVNTAVYVARNGEYLGYLTLTDELKPDAQKAVKGLKKAGVERIVMLTGDKKSTAEAVGEKLGVDEVWAQLLPQDKVAKMEELLDKKGKDEILLFTGDGINDAPALTRADVGISMGLAGSDAATDAADVVLMTDEPSKIPVAIEVARKTLVIVRQNVAFILIVKFGVLLLGAVGMASMWMAVFADVGVSVLAVLNAMRIFLYRRRGQN